MREWRCVVQERYHTLGNSCSQYLTTGVRCACAHHSRIPGLVGRIRVTRINTHNRSNNRLTTKKIVGVDPGLGPDLALA